jgi:hypothetical protein
VVPVVDPQGFVHKLHVRKDKEKEKRKRKKIKSQDSTVPDNHVGHACGKVRSDGYHKQYPLKSGKEPLPSLCTGCRYARKRAIEAGPAGSISPQQAQTRKENERKRKQKNRTRKKIKRKMQKRKAKTEFTNGEPQYYRHSIDVFDFTVQDEKEKQQKKRRKHNWGEYGRRGRGQLNPPLPVHGSAAAPP